MLLRKRSQKRRSRKEKTMLPRLKFHRVKFNALIALFSTVFTVNSVRFVRMSSLTIDYLYWESKYCDMKFTGSSLIYLQFLCHFIVKLFSLLNLLSHCLLLSIVLFDELVSVLDLVVDHCQTIRESCFDFLFTLVYHDSSNLFVYFSILG